MEEHNEVTTILKSNDPEKLIVSRATSLDDQIRFYLNETQYMAAEECEGDFFVKIGEESERKEEHKKSLKEFIKIGSFCLGILLLPVIGLSHLLIIIDNILLHLFVIVISFLIIKVVIILVIEGVETEHSIKSKHSAEHKMVNFLEINKRLPKNIEEIRKCSRFSPNCVSFGRKLIEEEGELFIGDIITAIFTAMISVSISYFCDNSLVNLFVFTIAYCLGSFITVKFITKHKMMTVISRPINKVLNIMVQCANTTSKIEENDIFLAYWVAREWIQVVYPEFYSSEGDTFWKQYFEVNS